MNDLETLLLSDALYIDLDVILDESAVVLDGDGGNRPTCIILYYIHVDILLQ